MNDQRVEMYAGDTLVFNKDVTSRIRLIETRNTYYFLVDKDITTFAFQKKSVTNEIEDLLNDYSKYLFNMYFASSPPPIPQN